MYHLQINFIFSDICSIFSFTCFIAKTRSSNTMLSKNRHSYPDSNIRDNFFSFQNDISTRTVLDTCFQLAVVPYCYFLFLGCIYSFLAILDLIAVCRLSLVVAGRGYSLLLCSGFSLQWLLLLKSTGSRCVGSVVVTHGLSCLVAFGILPEQGLNTSSALAGRFLTTVPPGKPSLLLF